MDTEHKYKYYAFISYKREDEEWAKWLQHKLEHYKLPSNLNGRGDLPKEIRPVFKDTSELNPGNLPQQIHDALEQSKYLIVICSPRSAQSEWVNKEVETFMGMGKTDRIIPFIIDGRAFAKNPDEECFPLAIRNLPSEQEILGANIGEMGRDAAAVKVVAQMFGLKFDELWQRHEREQRRKRLLIIAGALLLALAGVAVALGFSRQNKRIREQNDMILNKNERLQNDSIMMAAQMDSIKLRDSYISEQQDSITLASEQLYAERDNLKKSNWKKMENQSRIVAETALDLVEKNDYITAQRILLEVLPKDLKNPDRPYTKEAELALRRAFNDHLATLEGHTKNIKCIDYSPDGNRIVSASSDKTIKIWDARFGKWDCISTLEGHSGAVMSVNFSPDGRYIVSGSDDKTIKIWDAQKYKCIKTLEGHNGDVQSVDYSHDGIFIVSASGDSTIKIWDAKTGDCLHTLKEHNARVYSAKYSPNGQQIVSGSADSTIRIWDAKSGVCLRTIKGLARPVYCVNYNSDGRKIISALYYDGIKIYSPETGQCIKSYESMKYAKYAAFVPNSRYFITERALCDTNGYMVKGLGSYVSCISPNRHFIASADWSTKNNNAIITILDARTEFNYVNSFDYNEGSVQFSQDGENLISFSSKEIKLMDENGTYLKTLAKRGQEKFKKIDYSIDGKRIVTAGANGTITIWDTATGDSVMTIKDDFLKSINSIKISADGKQIVATATYGQIDNRYLVILDAETGRRLEAFENTYFLGFGWIRYADNEKIICNLSSVNREQHESYISEKSGIRIEIFNTNNLCSNGKRLVYVYRNQLQTVDFEINRTMYLRDNCLDPTITFDGRWFAVKTYGYNNPDNFVRIYDFETGLPINSSINYYNQSVSYAVLSPDGYKVLTKLSDGKIVIHSIPTLQALIDRTRECFKNNPLTPEERRQYYLE